MRCFEIFCRIVVVCDCYYKHILLDATVLWTIVKWNCFKRTSRHVVTLLEFVNLSQMFPAKLPTVFLAMVLEAEDKKLAWQVFFFFFFQRACSTSNSLGGAGCCRDGQQAIYILIMPVKIIHWERLWHLKCIEIDVTATVLLPVHLASLCLVDFCSSSTNIIVSIQTIVTSEFAKDLTAVCAWNAIVSVQPYSVNLDRFVGENCSCSLLLCNMTAR